MFVNSDKKLNEQRNETIAETLYDIFTRKATLTILTIAAVKVIKDFCRLEYNAVQSV
jgi:hypothetical protein